MSYDPRCFELAHNFLDSRPLTKDDRDWHAHKMAQFIQDAVEAYFTLLDTGKSTPLSK